MNISDTRKWIIDAVNKLNDMQDSLIFELYETNNGIGFKNHGRLDSNRSFGAYEHLSLFSEYKKKIDTYTNTMMFAEMIIAATKLNDPKSYHYLCNHWRKHK